MARPRIATAAAVLAVLLAGCGGDKAVLKQSDTAASSSPGGGTSTTAVGGGAGGPSTTTDKAKGTATTAKPGGAPAASGAHTDATVPEGNFKLTVTVSQRCTRPGGVQVVTVTGKAQGIVTYVVEYADGRAHSNSNGGLVDGKGVFRDQFVVSPDAPPGVARLTANEASKHDGLGFGRVEFTVGSC